MTAVFAPSTFLVTPRPAPPRQNLPDLHISNVRWGVPLMRPLTGKRGSKRVGLEYERRVHDVMTAIYGTNYVMSPPILYTLRGHRKMAIPDGILRLQDVLWILEVKLGHTERVWEQLMERYVPLVRALEPGRRIRAVEVCRSYDPAVNVPHTLITSLHSGCSPGLEVMQWKI
jgi:hypothetical protein